MSAFIHSSGFVHGFVVGGPEHPCDRPVSSCRRAVVIDPEDREQVERLTEAYEKASGGVYGRAQWIIAMQAVLREFANPTPPKPDEPTGLGAVVEDEDGEAWVRYARRYSTAPWVNGMTSVEWDDIAAVRVLSEGVTA